ncbi:ABC transporter permease [Pseudorhodoferax sp.]|jgi:putative ABC transport system permease protein|uniref:ABC transporter permease n=1 Tax=Pseudorhodoferax sp. TaxID=1993553 RepID=UPI001B5854C5|nr:FtsX-like permease family protein [Pseudorhodoferax sp.]MBP8145567.1 ABC transporter permease [Inhella sp.]
MFLLKLLLRNAFRHPLRTGLTLLGLVVAISAFGLLRTINEAWYAGVQASSATRLISRNAISLTFALPLSYAERLRGVDGVAGVSWANWFGGVYQSERNFFPQFAIEPASYLKLYSEYRLSDEEKAAFIRDRQGAIVGRKLANQYGWKIGDTIPIRGTIFPGTWTFTLRGIWDGAEASTDESQLLFHWQLLNESVKKRFPKRGDQVGVFVLGIDEPQQAAAVSQQVDALFKNSLAETLTETESAFQLSFVAMSEAILVAIEAVSYIIVLIILAVMANTMTMTARERLAEYATLKALGFGPGFVSRLLFGESLVIALIGGAAGIALTFPIAAAFAKAAGSFLSVFLVSDTTVLLQAGAALGVGLIAAAWPAWQMGRIDIVNGLRHVA